MENFLQQTAHKLLDLYVHLRELGYPQYNEQMVNKFLNCAINRQEANQKVCERGMRTVVWCSMYAALYVQHEVKNNHV